jgi:phage RecT family recombinase
MSDTKPGTAIALRDAILSTAEKYTDQIGKLAPEGASADSYLVGLRLYLAQNAKLLDCTPVSVALGLLLCAQTGLVLGVSADLLPFGKVCQFSPRYGGIIELALAAGTNSINADVVRDGDEFSFEKGTKFFLRHTRKFQKGAKITHAYAIAGLRFGQYVFEVRNRVELDAHKQRYSLQWKQTDLDEIPWYAKKTMVRQLSPFLPKNPRLAAALLFADTREVEDADAHVIDTPPADVDPETGEIAGAPEGVEEL